MRYVIAFLTAIALPAHAEEERQSALPAAIGLAAAVALTQYHGHFCEGYPCAHVSHIATGMAIGYFGTKYYGNKPAWIAGSSFAILKELADKHNGKGFRSADVATRVLGTGIGIYIYREF